MIGRLFAHKPPLDAQSAQWIVDTHAWALRSLDPNVFQGQRFLVTPTNEHFPGREDNPHGMAKLIFSKVVEYAGLTHWPLRLSDPNSPRADVQLSPLLSSQSESQPPQKAISLDYDPRLIGNPEALISHFAQSLAHHVALRSTEPPPGGMQNWPQLTEMLTVFMGFGLMTVNSAFNYRPPTCGSGGCSGGGAERQSFLSQYDLTYALALFCKTREIPKQDVLRHLKSSLRGFYKQSLKDLDLRGPSLAPPQERATTA